MRLDTPRIAPVDLDRLDTSQLDALTPLIETGGGKVGGGVVLNIFRTLARTPQALTAFLGWGSHLLSRRNSLPPRERELVILRTGFLCKSGYEWMQHHRIGLDCGLTAEEIERIKAGAEAAGWTPLESAMLLATDELVRDHFISDTTWAALADLGDQGRMSLVYTVGQYTQVSMMLNSFGVQLEDGSVDPDLRA